MLLSTNTPTKNPQKSINTYEINVHKCLDMSWALHVKPYPLIKANDSKGYRYNGTELPFYNSAASPLPPFPPLILALSAPIFQNGRYW